MTVWLLVEATKRFFEPPQVKGDLMLIVAIMGLIFNLIQMKILHSGEGHYHLGGDHDHGEGGGCSGHGHGQEKAKKKIDDPSLKENFLDQENNGHDHHGHDHDKHEHNHGHDHHGHDHHGHDHGHDHGHHHGHSHGTDVPEGRNINVDAAFLHVLGDMLMSVGVIIAALFIYFYPSLWYADPLCTYLFSVIVMTTTLPIIKNIIGIMMEGAPKNIDVEQLESDLATLNTDDIVDVHDLHVWSLSAGKLSMSVHITSRKPLKTLSMATDLCRRKYNLFHTTIQVEGVEDNKQNPHTFNCQNDIHDTMRTEKK